MRQGRRPLRHPWFEITPDHTAIRVKSDRAAGPRSFFEIYRRLITLRHESPVLQLGDFAMLEPEHPTLDAFTRSLSDKTLTVVGHYSREPLELPFAVGATW